MSSLPVGVHRDAAAGDPVALARALVAIPSVNPVLAPGGAGEEAIAAQAAEWLDAWGFRTDTEEVAAARFNVVATLPGGPATLLLNGHLDTVGVDGMTVDPFGAVVENGRMAGRGSCDMKGGLAALLSAAHRLSKDGRRPGLVVALTADEEHASVGMDALVRSGVAADMAVVCEPTSLAVMPAHKGFVWIEASFQGKAAHGSRPDQGVDAIRHAALFLSALDGYRERLEARTPHPLLSRASFHASTVEGGTAESVYPDRCRLMLERRTLPGEAPTEVLRNFQEVLDSVAAKEPGLDGSLRITLDRPGTEVDRRHRLVRGLLEASRAEGLAGHLEGMTAWVDAAFLNGAGIPAVCFGPGSIAQAHSADEWIHVAEITACSEVLCRFAGGLVDG